MLSVFYFLRLCVLNSITRLNIYVYLNKIFLTFVIFMFFVTLVSLNSLLLYYHDLVYLNNTYTDTYINFFFNYNNIIPLNAVNLNLVEVYCYPFIYVFLLITILSIIFCLTYNTDELMSFMFYCSIILLAGYTLFFTDSLILFFLAYEMLLVPSFFILYKFAKTRRCVEAAYLMFF